MSQVPNSTSASPSSGTPAQASGPGAGSILSQPAPAPGASVDTLLGNANDTSASASGGTPSASAGVTSSSAASMASPASPSASIPQMAAIGEGLRPLPADATVDQQAWFRDQLRALNGVPSAASDYGDFGFGAELKIDQTAEDYKYYSGLFHDVGLSKDQAKKLLAAHKSFSEGQLEHYNKQQDQMLADYRTLVKNDFVKSLGGEEQFTQFKDTAVRGFQAAAKGAKLNQKEVSSLLGIMGDDPRFIKIFNGVGRLFREDVLVSGAAPGAPEPTMEDIFAKMFSSNNG